MKIGEGYHVARLRRSGQKPRRLVEVDADHWKSWFHERLAASPGRPGALGFFAGEPNEHLTIARHFTAECRVEEFLPGRGRIVRWKRMHRSNHFLDAGQLACVAGHLAGVRLIVEAPAKPPAEQQATTSRFAARQRGRRR